jgi:hypothetical protein
MLRIFAANNHHYAIAPDDLAVLTTRFDRGTYFHKLALHRIYRQNSPGRFISTSFTEEKGRPTLQPLRDMDRIDVSISSEKPQPACFSHHN